MAGGTKDLPQENVIAFYAALALLLFFSRLLGEIATKLKQPAVLGEILAGVLLGKTVFYRIWPAGWLFLFGTGRLSTTAIQAITSFASSAFMLVAGLEMDLTQIIARKHKPIVVGFCTVAFPFIIGFVTAYANPPLMGATEGMDTTVYAMFAGTAMAITAMPVVAKTLRDLGLFQSEIGLVVMSSATVDDLIGWSLFAVVLSLADPKGSPLPQLGSGIIGVAFAFVVFVLIFGRVFLVRMLPWIQTRLSYPGGTIGFVICCMLISSCLATVVGLHNTLGSFLIGAAFSNAEHLRANVRETLDFYSTYALAPIFFAYIAVNVDFVANFDIALVAIVLTIACIGKFIGAIVGTKLTGSKWREAFAVAACMNSRGAMEVLLANVAYAAGIIDGRMLVALLFMAIITSLLPGPILRRILKRKDLQSFTRFLSKRTFIPNIQATNAHEAIIEMCTQAKLSKFIEGFHEQEAIRPSGSRFSDFAVSAIRVADIPKPIIIFGISKNGINFQGGVDSDNENDVSHIVVLVITPFKQMESDWSFENQLIQEISLVLSRKKFCKEVVFAKTYFEVLSLFSVEKHRLGLESTHQAAVTDVPSLQVVDTPTPLLDAGLKLDPQTKNALKEEEEDDDDDEEQPPPPPPSHLESSFKVGGDTSLKTEDLSLFRSSNSSTPKSQTPKSTSSSSSSGARADEAQSLYPPEKKILHRSSSAGSKHPPSDHYHMDLV